MAIRCIQQIYNPRSEDLSLINPDAEGFINGKLLMTEDKGSIFVDRPHFIQKTEAREEEQQLL